MANVENVVVTKFTADTHDLTRRVDEIDRRMGRMAGNVERSMGRSRIATLALGAGLAAATVAAVKFGREAFAAAARAEELDIAMQAIGASTGKGYEALNEATQAIRNNGIELAASQQIAIEFAQNNLDMASASKVARVAQDLAVIGAKNSTATTQLLTRAIITGRSELLKSAGISRLAGEAYKEYADQLGKGVTNLTAAERQTAVINLILDEGTKVAGTYEASMNSAGKVLRSFPRLINDLQIEFGQLLLRGLGPIIKATYDLFSAFTKLFREGGALYDVMTALQHVFDRIGRPITKLLESFKSMITVIPVKQYEELKSGLKDLKKPLDSVVKVADRLSAKQKELSDKTKLVTDRVQKFYDILSKLVPLFGATLIAGATKFGASLVGMITPLRFLVPLFNPLVAFIVAFIALSPQIQGHLINIVQAFAPFVRVLKDFAELIIGGIVDGIAVFTKVLSAVADSVVGALKPISDLGKNSEDLAQKFANLKPIIAAVTFGFISYKVALLAAAAASKLVSFAIAVKNGLLLISNVIIGAAKAAYIGLRGAVLAAGTAYVLTGLLLKAFGATVTATTILVTVLKGGLVVLAAGFKVAAKAALIFSLKLMLPITIIGLLILAAYKLYQGMATYFGEGAKTVDDFVYDVASFLNTGLKHFSAFLNNISNFAAHVIAFFKKIGAVGEAVMAKDFKRAIELGKKPLDDFLGDILKFDLNIDGLLANLKKNKPMQKILDFIKDGLKIPTVGGAGDEPLATPVEKGIKKAVEDILKAYEDAFSQVNSAQLSFAQLFDRPFGLEPSEIEQAYGVEGTTKSVISMSKQLQGAIMDMYKPLLDTELFSKKAVASARRNMESHLADLQRYTERLHALHREREEIARTLNTLRTTYDEDIREINESFDGLDKGARKNLERLEKYYDGLIKGLRATLDTATKAFDQENKKLQDIIGKRDQFLSRAADGLRGFANQLSFKSAADQIKKDGSRSNKIIKETVKDIGNGIRVTIREEIEPAMEDLSGLKLTATDIRGQLQERLDLIREFAQNVQTLAARGLDAGLLEELVSAGASQAGDVVSALASASADELAEINRIQNDLQTQVAAYTQFASAQFYDSAVAQQEAIVAPLQTAVDLAQQAFDNAEVLREAELTAAREQIEVLRELRETALDEREAEYNREVKILQDRSKEIDAELKTLAVEAYDFFLALGNKTVLDMFNNGKNMADNTRKGFNDRFPKLKSRLNELMDRLAASMKREATVTVTTVYKSVYEETNKKAAMGARVLGTHAYLVGERGPEMFMPSGAGQIIPAHETARALRGGAMGTSTLRGITGGGNGGGNTYQINVNVPISANQSEVGRQIVDAIAAYERRNGKVYEPA